MQSNNISDNELSSVAPLNILLVDDHLLFREGLSLVLDQVSPSSKITGVSKAADAITKLQSGEDFDVILLDLSMPDMDGYTFLKTLYEKEIWVPVLVISATEDPMDIKKAMGTGAMGFVNKSVDAEELLHAISQVTTGNTYIPSHHQEAIKKAEENAPLTGKSAAAELGITPRQFEVLTLLSEGLSNKRICQALNLTEHTVKSHISALFRTLNVHNRTACVLTATKLKLIESNYSRNRAS